MKILHFLFLLFLVSPFRSQTLPVTESARIKLPNGWALTPAGHSLLLGDLPLNMAVSSSKKYLAVTNNGQSKQLLELIDVFKQKVIDSVYMHASWLGLAFSPDDRSLFVSGGNDNYIVRFDIRNKHLLAKDTLVLGMPWPVKISPAGLAISNNNLLYVVTRENNSLYVVNVTTKKAISKVDLPAEAYTCLLSRDQKTLFISCWGCDKLLLYDTENNRLRNNIAVGEHPNDMFLSKNGLLLYVANANDNSVSVFDTKSEKVIEKLNAALYPDSPYGSTTNGLSLSEDNTTLFIANADNNCLAVFDVSHPGKSKSKGFIPTGWYPTCVKVINTTIYVANGKGFSSFSNPLGPSPIKKEKKENPQYIAALFRGTLSQITIPDEKQLAVYSQDVYENTPYKKNTELLSNGPPGNPIPVKVGLPSPIKYVFYIIKENRTYDQVLGDILKGNGDSSLVLFGKKITPNQHALCDQFVLYDNFYVDAEVSADGHNWSTAAYATDYLEKTWPTSYGGRGGNYDSEGNRKLANTKKGFIWDLCKKNDVTFRTYGEFADNNKPNIPVLKNHLCPNYSGWDQSVRDTTRFRQWKKDFDSLLHINQVPHLNTLRFINDHTQGLSKGKPSPFAQVADNDLATGMFIDYLSKSSIWKESVVFILEDDAQDGADHVDAHRSTLYVCGGFVKRKFTDHSMYSTSSVLKTIEFILGLPPMSQYDAAANTLWRSFADSANSSTFSFIPEMTDLNQKNKAENKWQKKSELFDFSKEDMVPDIEFNEVIWVAVKGENSICPPPCHAAFLRELDSEDD